MNSKIYLLIADKVIDLFPEEIRELPYDLIYAREALRGRVDGCIKLFLNSNIKLLKQNPFRVKDQILELILTHHKLIISNQSSKLNKANNATFIQLLSDCFRVRQNDEIQTPALLLSILIFILESSAYYGFCDNKSEQHIKKTSHILAEELLKIIYHIPKQYSTPIVGYLKSSWYLAQKTEGVRDIEADTENIKVPKKYTIMLQGKEFHIQNTIEELFVR